MNAIIKVRDFGAKGDGVTDDTGTIQRALDVATRGRPKLTMTHRRRQVLRYLTDCARKGERITLGRLVRSCGLYDRSAAKRIIRDLRQMGEVS